MHSLRLNKKFHRKSWIADKTGWTYFMPTSETVYSTWKYGVYSDGMADRVKDDGEWIPGSLAYCPSREPVTPSDSDEDLEAYSRDLEEKAKKSNETSFFTRSGNMPVPYYKKIKPPSSDAQK